MNIIVVWFMLAKASTGDFVYESHPLPSNAACVKFEKQFAAKFNTVYRSFTTTCIETEIVK